LYIRFDNKVAVITGAGKGLGRSYALELAARGAKLVINDNGETVDEKGKPVKFARLVVDQITASGGEAVANLNDVADEESAYGIIQSALDHYGKVDILINNAGFIRDKSFIKMTPEDFKSVMDVHLYGSYFTTRAAFPFMKKNNYGRIIMTTSTSGLYGNFGQANYDAAKLGLIGLMNALKEEGKKYNITVNTIAPLAVTRKTRPIYPKEIADRLKRHYVAAMVAYLCSDKCTSTGSIITAGGGFYTRNQIVEGKGYIFGPDEEVTPEAIGDKFSAISDMDNAMTFENSSAAVLRIFDTIKTNGNSLNKNQKEEGK